MSEPSGALWCARFPTSELTTNLAEPFRANAERFIKALETAGARVDIAATFRPPERAYLMHWCWMIGNGLEMPAHVPALEGVAIDWTRGGDVAAAREAAKAMIAGYGLLYRPSLISRHCEGRAIDMRISWNDVLCLRTASGASVTIATMPRNGENRDLHAVGAGYGVHKLVSDPPHWSDDGH